MKPEVTHVGALSAASHDAPAQVCAEEAASTDTVTYAIGDVHGMGRLLQILLREIDADARSRKARPRVIFLGDLFDRKRVGHPTYL